MTKRTLVKTHPKGGASQWLGVLALVGMTFAFINLAMAITSFTPRDQPTGYIAQDEISNFNLTSGNETVYRPGYEIEL